MQFYSLLVLVGADYFNDNIPYEMDKTQLICNLFFCSLSIGDKCAVESKNNKKVKMSLDSKQRTPTGEL